MKTKIERNIPASYTETKGNDFGTVHFQPATIGKVCAIAYKGNARKSAWHYTFHTQANLLPYVEAWLNTVATEGAERAQRLALRAEFDARTAWAIGEVVVNHWGYEQTNVDFYQVIGVTKKFLALRKVQAVRASDGPLTMTGTTTPVRNVFAGELIRRSVTETGYVNFTHGAGSKWEGKREHFSTYA